MSTTYEGWVAAGKPCLRRGCGHRYGDHIPSEGMECDACDCPWFVGIHPDDAAVWSSLRAPPIVKNITTAVQLEPVTATAAGAQHTLTRWVQDICDSRVVEYPA
jgi:hypothetical protein